MNIEEIKGRLIAAHKGPWHVAEAGSNVLVPDLSKPDEPYFSQAEDNSILGPDQKEVLGCSEWLRCKRADLEFMAHARQDIEDLLAEVERLTG